MYYSNHPLLALALYAQPLKITYPSARTTPGRPEWLAERGCGDAAAAAPQGGARDNILYFVLCPPLIYTLDLVYIEKYYIKTKFTKFKKTI